MQAARVSLVKHAAAWAAFALCLLAGPPAWADVWGYVDERGIPHFSASRLDDRYELFLRGADEAPSPQAAAAAWPAHAAPVATPAGKPPRLMAYLEALPSYHAVQPLLSSAAQATGLDVHLLAAVIAAESGFDPRAVSPKGAVGLMQLIVPTAERYGVRADRSGPVQSQLMDPQTNIRAGSRYLRDLLALFPGRLDLALAAYNAGEGAVQRAGKQVPNYPETQNYVRTVTQLYRHLQAVNGVQPTGPSGSVNATSAATLVPVARVGGAVGRGNMLPPFEAQPLLGPMASSPGLLR